MEAAHWYVVKVVSGDEKKISSYMNVEVKREKCETLVKEILVPSKQVYEMRNGKKRLREKNFYPGYILIHADLSGGKLVDLLTNLPGVLGFLGTTGRTSREPAVLRKTEMRRILGKIGHASADSETEEETSGIKFLEGESVRVMDGPFSGFDGEVKSVQHDKKKLTVTVKIFGRNTPIDLNFFQVEKQS